MQPALAAMRPGVEALAGIHPVLEALRAGRRTLHRVCRKAGPRGGDSGPIEAILAAARERQVPVVEVSREELDGLVPPGVAHQGVVLEASPLPGVGLDALAGAPEVPRWLLALDGIEDPQNFGALLRVADAAGVAGVVTSERRSSPLSPAAARASAGASEHVPVARVTNLGRALRTLKDHGYWIYGADAGEGDDLWGAPDRMLAERRVLVLGAEGRGLRPGVRSALDALLRIPMGGAVGSLNVATAAAVLLFEWRRRSSPEGETH